jgi:hypothetical protein
MSPFPTEPAAAAHAIEPPSAAFGTPLAGGAFGILALIVWLLCTGCATDELFRETVVGPGFQPANVFREAPKHLAGIRRVALMPMNLSDHASASAAGRESLQPLLASELGKTRRFEVVQLSPTQLKQWSGRSEWAAEDVLPPTLFTRIREETGCEAVLFSRLTQFRAYQPVAIGWSLKLVTLEDTKIVWAVDEVFDSSEPAVVNAARRYYLAHQRDDSPLGDSRLIVTTPGRFARYAAYATFASLEPR